MQKLFYLCLSFRGIERTLSLSMHVRSLKYYSTARVLIIGCEYELGRVTLEKYCKAMKQLGMKLMELLAISLGVDRLDYRELFEDGCSIMRCNNYPCCKQPGLVLGTGPHCDPTSITILHQDQVGGLDVFADNRWQTVRPHPNALVVNIGDTFKVSRPLNALSTCYFTLLYLFTCLFC